MKQPSLALISVFLITLLFPIKLEASFFSDLIANTRQTVQKSFQLDFIDKIPVLFHKDTLQQDIQYVADTIDNLSITKDDKTITITDIQSDKALHIKKTAELALRLKSFTGSSHLAYGIAMFAGVIKELIDGSFLHPTGSREFADLVADHIGAMSVFGNNKFESAIDNNLNYIVKEGVMPIEPSQTNLKEENDRQVITSPFDDKDIKIGN